MSSIAQRVSRRFHLAAIGRKFETQVPTAVAHAARAATPNHMETLREVVAHVRSDLDSARFLVETGG